MRILLVDDHPIVRHGIRRLLTERIPALTVEEVGDADTALESIRAQPWDVVVLDVTMPGTSGIDLLKTVRRENQVLPILVLSMHAAAQFAQRVVAAGGSGYLTKDAAPAELVNAIDQVRRGRSYPAPQGRHGASAATLHDRLSDREYQVLRLIGSGSTVSEIAAELGLSVKTVSTYRARVLEKLEMQTNAQLMRYAIENALIDS
jgi:two-component system invasion response regulator UvrY